MSAIYVPVMRGIGEFPIRATVDESLGEAVLCRTWRAWTSANGVIYARGQVGGKRVFLHRFVASLLGMDGRYIDHINRDPLDNRAANLRPATAEQNGANRSSAASKSGVRGVHRHKNGWVVKFRSAGRLHYFGLYRSVDMAAEVARKAVHAVYGEFAPIEQMGCDVVQRDSRAAEIAALEARIKELSKAA